MRSLVALIGVAVLAGCGARASTAGRPSCAAAVVVAHPSDLAGLAGCTTLRGLTIRTGAALDVAQLRALTTITGDLVVGPTVAIDAITLGALRTVHGTIRIANNGLLQGVFLPRLERAGSIVVDGNVAITTLSLPRLAAVRGPLRITDNASLELVDAPMLVSVTGEVVVSGAPRLTLLEAGQLRDAGQVRLDAPKLPDEVVDRLRGLATTP